MEDPFFQREVLDRLITLETLIKGQDYKGLNQKVEGINKSLIKNEQIIDANSSRISKLEDTNKWLWRSIGGALLLEALAILFGI